MFLKHNYKTGCQFIENYPAGSQYPTIPGRSLICQILPDLPDNGIVAEAEGVDLPFQHLDHGIRAADIKNSVLRVDVFLQEVFGDQPFRIFFGRLLRQYVDEILIKQFRKIVPVNDVGPRLVGKNQFVVPDPARFLQLAEYGDKGRDPRPTRNEDPFSPVGDGTEEIMNDEFVTFLQMEQLSGHSFVGRVGLDDKLQELLVGQ